YDVIGPEELHRLEQRSPYNVVHLDLARDEDGRDRYVTARERLRSWQEEGVLVADAEPGFYVYRMRYHDEAGRARQAAGVLGAVAAIAAAVGSAPIVIADGHHRYETALAFRDELRGQGAGPGDHDLLMAFVVELADEQLSVRPIHRLLSGLPAGFDLVAALAQSFDPFDAGPAGDTLSARMADAGALALVLPD